VKGVETYKITKKKLALILTVSEDDITEAPNLQTVVKCAEIIVVY
jgi:hypothetical protein